MSHVDGIVLPILKKRVLLLSLLGLALASGCFSPRFKTSPSKLPGEAPRRVSLETEGEDSSLTHAFAALMAEQLNRQGVEVGSKPSSAPGAILQAKVEREAFTYVLYIYYGTTETVLDFVPNVPRLLLNVKIMKGSEGSGPYLSMAVPLNGAIFGVAAPNSASERFTYRRVESVEELTAKAARLVAAIYLNAMGGSPEPVEGEWVGADDGVSVVFRKGSQEGHYSTDDTAVALWGMGDRAFLMMDADIGMQAADAASASADAREPPVDNVRHFKGRYRLGSVDSYPKSHVGWRSARFHIHGCLMVVDGVVGRAFLVKKNPERCHL
jgi:hypothetical protein